MLENILSIILLVVIAYAVYLQKNLNDEKIRREWDLAYFYYQTHQQDFDALTKEYFFEDFPLLKKVLTLLISSMINRNGQMNWASHFLRNN